MELEDLKHIWDKASNESGAADKNPAARLDVNSASQNLFYRMRHNLFIELLIVLVSVSVVAIYYFTAYEGRLRQISWLYILLAAVFGLYYYKKSRLIKAMECSACNVKTNLQQQLKTLETWVRLYLIAGTLAVPLVMGVFYTVLRYNHFIIQTPFNGNTDSIEFGLIYLLFTVIFTVGLFFFHRWYIQRFYGRYIKKLKRLVAEMQDE